MQSDTHKRARFLIDEALIAEITRDDERWLQDHKQECGECANYADVAAQILRGFDALSFDADPAMITRVQDSLAMRAEPRRPAAAWRWALIAAALLVAVAPIYKNMTERRREAEIERADTMLLERVNARVAQTLPEAMEPLARPAAGGER
jgi:predicted anti-sigma-YlaC factor YlaD